MPLDPRENLLEDLRLVNLSQYIGYLDWFGIALEFLDDQNSTKPPPMYIKARKEIERFVDLLTTEKGPPSLSWVLVYMDIAQSRGRGELKNSSRRLRRRVTLTDAKISLLEAKAEVARLIGVHKKSMRLMNQRLI
jgi:hypothetical protein